MSIRNIFSCNAFGRTLALLSILGLAACGGASGGNTTPRNYTAPDQPAIGSIASVTAAAVAEPYLTGSTVIHYCDCQTGNAVKPVAGCVAGDDANGIGSADLPFQNVGFPGYSSSTTYAS